MLIEKYYGLAFKGAPKTKFEIDDNALKYMYQLEDQLEDQLDDGAPETKNQLDDLKKNILKIYIINTHLITFEKKICLFP